MYLGKKLAKYDWNLTEYHWNITEISLKPHWILTLFWELAILPNSWKPQNNHKKIRPNFGGKVLGCRIGLPKPSRKDSWVPDGSNLTVHIQYTSHTVQIQYRLFEKCSKTFFDMKKSRYCTKIKIFFVINIGLITFLWSRNAGKTQWHAYLHG